jgi:beta-N-acetylhexosaminidase
MKALTRHFSKAHIAVRALQAGNDLLLYCNEPDSPPQAIEAITKALESGELKGADLENSYQKILQMKKRTLGRAELEAWESAKKWIGHPDHQRLAEAISLGQVPPGLTAD